MSWDRRQRQEAILREKIATIVLERLSDPRLGFLTITKVELSRDKRIARVSYTVLGDDAQRRTTARALETAAPRIQELLAPTLSMRTLPEVRFVYAEEIAKESRLLTLIESIEQERADDDAVRGSDDGDPDAPADLDTADAPAAADPSDPAPGDDPDADGASPRT